VKAFNRGIAFFVEWLQMQAVSNSHPIKIFPMLIQYFKWGKQWTAKMLDFRTKLM